MPLVDAPRPAAGDKEIEKYKAEENCQLAHIDQRKEISRGMSHEVGDRHITGENKCDRSRE
jgi:hypothetical protein